MTLTSLISSIIALAFLYTVFSVFASELQEYIAAIFESRAKRLKQSIRQMLGEQDWPFYPLEIEGEKPTNNDSKIWIKDGKIRVIKNSDNIFPEGQDKQFIWIKDSDKTEVKDNEVIQKKGKIDHEFVTQHQVCLINDKSKKFIWIKDKDNKTEVEASQVQEIGKAKVNDENVTKYPVYTVISIQGKESQNDSIYWLDIDKKRITNRITNPNKEITNINLTDFSVDSITEKLYQHPNIRALNQSSFAWFYLLKNSVQGIVGLLFGILFLVGALISVLKNSSFLLLLCLAFFTHILHLTRQSSKPCSSNQGFSNFNLLRRERSKM